AGAPVRDSDRSCALATVDAGARDKENTPPAFDARRCGAAGRRRGWLAQLVVQRTLNPLVRGSSPRPPTKTYSGRDAPERVRRNRTALFPFTGHGGTHLSSLAPCLAAQFISPKRAADRPSGRRNYLRPVGNTAPQSDNRRQLPHTSDTGRAPIQQLSGSRRQFSPCGYGMEPAWKVRPQGGPCASYRWRETEMATDFTLEDHGNVCLLKMNNYGARQWARERIAGNRQYFGRVVVVETRYVESIVAEIEDDGLTVAGARRNSNTLTQS